MERTGPATLPTTDGRGESPFQALLLAVRNRLAEVSATRPTKLVAGVWKPASDVCLVALAGEIDMSNAAELAESLEAPFAVGPCDLLVDVSQLTFIDSAGVSELFKAAKRARGADRAIVLVAPSGQVARVFDVVGIGTQLAVAESLEAALEQVSTASPSEPETAGRRSAAS
jgi:anti-sigma B factor antagonist